VHRLDVIKAAAGRQDKRRGRRRITGAGNLGPVAACVSYSFNKCPMRRGARTWIRVAILSSVSSDCWPALDASAAFAPWASKFANICPIRRQIPLTIDRIKKY